MLTRSTSTRMDDQWKDQINPKRPKQRNRSKQLQNYKLRTYDEDNINSTSKRRGILLAKKARVVLWVEGRMPQRTQKHSRVTLHRSTHPKWEQDQTEKSSYGLDWQQKGIRYGSTKLDNKQPQNIQNTTWSHEIYRKKTWNLGEWNWLQEGEA